MKIQVEHYTKRLKGVTVLEDVNVELCGGHIYGLRGKNGSGKTMFMRAVSGLMNASEGRGLVDGIGKRHFISTVYRRLDRESGIFVELYRISKFKNACRNTGEDR